jgi:hypothetical protein
MNGWWLFSKASKSNKFFLWHLTNDTILLISTQEVGLSPNRREGISLDICFRPEGDAFALSGSDHGLDLYYFDRLTGEISVWDQIDPSYDPDFEPHSVWSRCEWSADGRYLYVTNQRKLYQFDTHAPDIGASAVMINSPESLPFTSSYHQIQRGPDCRIYIGPAGTGRALSVIDKPSRPGKACELKDNGLLLPNIFFVGIPDFPNYSLWAKDRVNRGLAPIIDTAVCDSTIAAFDYFDWTSSTSDVLAKAENLSISPNPASSGNELTLSYDLPASLHGELSRAMSASLYSMSGQKIADARLLSFGQTSARVVLPEFIPSGVYFLMIGSSGRLLLECKVVVE